MIIGLTGGIASGKSTVCEILTGLGAYIIDTDAVSKTVSAEGTACNAALKKAFPTCVDGGILSRSLLKQLVFCSERDRKLLNSITHKYILEETKKLIKKNTIIAVPLLFESGFDKICDKTLCVLAPLAIRIERVMLRDKIDEKMAKKIIATQLDNEKLIKMCDYVIHNNKGLKELKKATGEWYKSLEMEEI